MTAPNSKTVRMKALRAFIGEEGSIARGEVFTTSPRRASVLAGEEAAPQTKGTRSISIDGRPMNPARKKPGRPRAVRINDEDEPIDANGNKIRAKREPASISAESTVEEIAAANAGHVAEVLPSIDDEKLGEIKAAETAGKARKGVLQAIEAEVERRSESRKAGGEAGGQGGGGAEGQGSGENNPPQ